MTREEKQAAAEHIIAETVGKWVSELTLAKYSRDHLSQLDTNNKSKAANVLDSLYNIALDAERDADKISAAETLLKIASADQKPTSLINQQFNFGQDEFVLKRNSSHK